MAYKATPEQIRRNKELVKLREDGWTFPAIGEYFKITKQTAYRTYYRDRAKYSQNRKVSKLYTRKYTVVLAK